MSTHSITVEKLTGTLADEVWQEHKWTCTCGAVGILDDRHGQRTRRAGEQHLVEAHEQYMTAVDELRAAADALECRAAVATPGPWPMREAPAVGLPSWYASPSLQMVGSLPDDAAKHGMSPETAEHDARWISTMSPSVAASLVAWLRLSIRQVQSEGDLLAMHRPALDFARAINATTQEAAA